MNRNKYIIVYASTESVETKAKDEFKIIENITNQHKSIFELEKHIEKVNVATLHTKLDEIIKNENVRKDSNKRKIILQLAGHSTDTQYNMPTSSADDAETATIAPIRMKDYFNNLGKHSIECVIFSSCSSVEFAEKVYELEEIVCSIGTKLDIKHNNSFLFTEVFYSTFAKNEQNYQEAIDAGKKSNKLLSKERNFFGKSKQKEKGQFIGLNNKSAEYQKNKELFSALKNSLAKIIEIGTETDIDTGLYERFLSAIKEINKIDNEFKSHFKSFENLNLSDPIAPHNKIEIFKFQQKLLFEYSIILTTVICDLLDYESLPDLVDEVIDQLISNCKLEKLYEHFETIAENEKIKYLKQQSKKIKEALVLRKKEMSDKAKMYKEIYSIVRVLTDDNPHLLNNINNTINVNVKQDKNKAIDDVRKHFINLNINYKRYRESVINLIPDHLTSKETTIK